MKYNTIKEKNVRNEVINIDNHIRQKYKFLKYQSFIGIMIAFFAATGFFLSSWLYFYGYIPMLLTIVTNAFCCSFLHELEHDTFHQQYFKNRTYVQNGFLAFLWLFKPNTINPWIRKKIHLHHHVHSGQEEDVEERLLGNGARYNLIRFLVMFDHIFALAYFKKMMAESKVFRPITMIFSLFPMYIIFGIIWIAWAYYHTVIGINHLFSTDYSVAQIVNNHVGILNFLMVVYIAPAILRVFCLHFITSNIHYYGGVGSTLEQTQVFKHWSFLPFNIFCCFFGETHAIHHIWVPQPFYLRHIIKSAAHKVMRNNGVHFNDFATFKRRNHYPQENHI